LTVCVATRTADGVRRRSVISLLGILLVASRTSAVVLGGGLPDTDCTVGFEGVTATDGASGVVCTDGDPTCDNDATADGSCRFEIRVCTRLGESGCTPRDVTSIAIAGLPFDRPTLSGGTACGTPDTFAVPAGSAVGATLIARDGDALKDVDYLNVCCRSTVAPFDAATCALDVDPASVAGCGHALPRAFETALEKARSLVAQAAADPTVARASAKRGVRALRHMRTIARKVAASDPCGDALALVATHAITVLRAALHATGS
jgi:hypothetical protein